MFDKSFSKIVQTSPKSKTFLQLKAGFLDSNPPFSSVIQNLCLSFNQLYDFFLSTQYWWYPYSVLNILHSTDDYPKQYHFKRRQCFVGNMVTFLHVKSNTFQTEQEKNRPNIWLYNPYLIVDRIHCWSCQRFHEAGFLGVLRGSSPMISRNSWMKSRFDTI